MQTQIRRQRIDAEESSKGRQLSSLFNIISSNLLLATEVLSSDYKIQAIQELKLLSHRARTLAKELMTNSNYTNEKDLTERISFLKRSMLDLVGDLTEELGRLDQNKNTDQKAVADIILARRLLRESQRGLLTVQD